MFSISSKVASTPTTPIVLSIKQRYCVFSKGVIYGTLVFYLIYQQQVRVLHQSFHTPRGKLMRNLFVSCFEVFGTSDETRSTSFLESSEFSVCNHVTRRPYWWSTQTKLFCQICIKIELIPSGEMLLVSRTFSHANATQYY